MARRSVSEFEKIEGASENSDRRFELIHGALIERFPTEEQGVFVGKIAGELMTYAKPRTLGRILVKVHYHIFHDNYNVRMIDISYIRDTTRPLIAKGYAPQLPDLAVDVQSRDDTKDTLESASYYLKNGSQLVWLVFPISRTIGVCTLMINGEIKVRTLNMDDVIDGGEVLPGFRLAVKDIFDV